MTFKITSKKDYLKENKKPNQLKVWNKIAKPWKTYVVKKIPIVEEFLKKASSLSKNNETIKIVDLGCGSGRNIIPIKEIEYYGVDFSEAQLKYAKQYSVKNKVKAKFFKSKIDNMPFKDNFFDYGLFIGSLHCLETEKKRLESLREFFRVLKPNSQSLISVWNSEDKRFNHVKNHGDIYMSWFEDNIPYMRYYYLYKKEELISHLKKVGFKIPHFYEQREHDRFSKKNWIARIEKS